MRNISRTLILHLQGRARLFLCVYLTEKRIGRNVKIWLIQLLIAWNTTTSKFKFSTAGWQLFMYMDPIKAFSMGEKASDLVSYCGKCCFLPSRVSILWNTGDTWGVSTRWTWPSPSTGSRGRRPRRWGNGYGLGWRIVARFVVCMHVCTCIIYEVK